MATMKIRKEQKHQLRRPEHKKEAQDQNGEYGEDTRDELIKKM